MSDGSTLSVPAGALTNLSGGTLTGGSYQINNTSASTPSTLILGDSVVTNQASIFLNGQGAVFNALNTLATNGSNGFLSLGTGSTLTTAGALTNAGGIGVSGNAATLTTNGSLTNSGALNPYGNGTVAVRSDLINNGQIEVGPAGISYGPPGVVTVTGVLTQSASGSLVGGGSLTAMAFSLVGALYVGVGVAGGVFSSSGSLTNTGTINLDAGSTWPVGGDFNAGPGSILGVTLGGTQSSGAQSPGILQVDGAATAGGTLALTFAAGAALPGNGEVLTIVSAGSPAQGTFANVAGGARLATTDGRGSFRVNYGGNVNTVTLSDFLLPGQVDPTPTAMLAAVVPSVVAGSGQEGELMLALSSAPSTDVVVNFTIKGTAGNGTDYVLLKASKKIKAGKTSKPIKITPLGAGAGTGVKRTVILTLQPGAGYQVGTTGKVKVKIIGE